MLSALDKIDTVSVINNAPEWGDEIDPPAERPVQYDQYSELFHPSNRCEENYNSFEKLGVPLTELSTVFAEPDSNIGAVSGMITRIARCQIGVQPIEYRATNVGVEVDIEFSEPAVLSKGFKVTMADDMKYILNMSINYPDSSYEEIFTPFEGKEFQIDPLSEEYSDIDWTAQVDSLYISVYTNISYNQLDADPVFCKLTGIDFGCDKYAKDIEGTVNIHGEIALTVDDAPGCTCDAVIQADFIPEEGETVIVESEYYNGKFIIDKVEREAQDIFSLQCIDDIQKLESYTVFRPTETEELGAYDDTDSRDLLFAGADVKWSEEPSGHVSAIWSDKVNSREAIAMFGLSTNSVITCWKDLSGVHQDKFKSRTFVKTIPEDRVFDSSRYEAKPSYIGVEFYVKLMERCTSNSVIYVDVAVNDNHSNGYYVMDKSMMRNEAVWTSNPISYRENASYVADYVNGDELTAEIVYADENLGDLVSIPTLYNGTVTGRIRSIDLQLGSNAAVATLIVRKVS